MKINTLCNGLKKSKLFWAVLINAAFLAVMLCCFVPVFETNDDVLMSKYVDGQLSNKTAYVPFINIVLGLVLKTLYSCFGDSFQWYSFSQYLLLYLSFTAITWVILRRFKRLPALCLTAVILCAFATDCYLSMNFSKPSAIATVGGMSLMLYALRNETGRTMKLPLILGFIMALCGYVWRFESFGICALLMAGVCLSTLLELLKDKALPSVKDKLLELLHYVAPFALLAISALLLYAVNTWAWHRDSISFYTDFDYTRSVLIDFEIPDYEQMPELYDELDMDENFVYMMKRWSFYDTEKFTKEAMDRIIDGRESIVGRRTPGECLGVFLDKCLLDFFSCRPVWGLAFMLAVWLACGKRQRLSDWIGVVYIFALFFVLYLVLIYLERYLANRVDIGFFFAMTMALSFFVQEEKADKEKLLFIAVLLMSVLVSYRSCRSACLFDSHNSIEDKSSQKAAVEELLSYEDRLYFVKVWSMDHELYGPLETAPAGFADRIVSIGSWSMHHPATVEILNKYSIENPYRDLVGNSRVCIIDNDIERTMAYINKYYSPNARAHLLEELSDSTELSIYQIW